jgi:hypothetical protein
MIEIHGKISKEITLERIVTVAKYYLISEKIFVMP